MLITRFSNVTALSYSMDLVKLTAGCDDDPGEIIPVKDDIAHLQIINRLYFLHPGLVHTFGIDLPDRVTVFIGQMRELLFICATWYQHKRQTVLSHISCNKS